VGEWVSSVVRVCVAVCVGECAWGGACVEGSVGGGQCVWGEVCADSGAQTRAR
jgi:hypothetical protein